MARIVQKVEPKTNVRLKIRRVCAYARVSSGKDSMLHSLSAQVSYYQTFIQSHAGWKFCGVYADEALTGTKEKRDRFQLMIEECRKGNIDLVVTKSISRFARNTLTLLQTVRELKSIGVEVFFEEQNIFSLSTEGEVMLTILASYAQEESLSVSENMKWRIRKGYESGQILQWRFLYGYDVQKGSVVVDEERAKVVREIYARFAGGESLGEIYRWLKEAGIKGLLGGEWTRARIYDTLNNEKYVGNILCQKRFVNNHLDKKVIKNNGQLPKYFLEGTHKGIIDPETFKRVRVRLQQNSEKYSRYAKNRTASVFSCKLVCEKCGAHLRRAKRHGYSIWACPTYSGKGKNSCSLKSVRADIVESAAAELMKEQGEDEKGFFSRLEKITVYDYKFVFEFYDGTSIEKGWKNKSRSDSWTPEMREQARQRRLKGEKICQE